MCAVVVTVSKIATERQRMPGDDNKVGDLYSTPVCFSVCVHQQRILNTPTHLVNYGSCTSSGHPESKEQMDS